MRTLLRDQPYLPEHDPLDGKLQGDPKPFFFFLCFYWPARGFFYSSMIAFSFSFPFAFSVSVSPFACAFHYCSLFLCMYHTNLNNSQFFPPYENFESKKGGKEVRVLSDRVGRSNRSSRLVGRGLLGNGGVGATVAAASVGLGVVPVGVDDVPRVDDTGNMSEEGQSNAVISVR